MSSGYIEKVSHTPEMILGLLHLSELSSYDIKKSLEKLASHYFSASLGSIVPALRKLEKGGLVRFRDASVGKRPKNLYSPTLAGQRYFARWLREPPEMGRGEDALLARIFFFGLLKEDERSAVVSSALERLSETEARLVALQKESTKRARNLELPDRLSEVPEFQIATIEFGVANYRFLQRWLRKRFLA